MQRSLSLRPNRFTAPVVITSLTLGFIITVSLASLRVDQMPMSPDQWWMWCWAGFGGWYGLTICLMHTSRARFIQLGVAGGLAFAVAQILTVTLFDSTTIALPSILAPILPFALFGGLGLGLFSCFLQQRPSIWSSLLLGCLSFGIGQSIDYAIRSIMLFSTTEPLSSTLIASVKLVAAIWCGLCIGVGSYLALKRR